MTSSVPPILMSVSLILATTDPVSMVSLVTPAIVTLVGQESSVISTSMTALV